MQLTPEKSEKPHRSWSSSIKGEVKKKHHPDGLRFSSFAAHANERDLF